MCAIKGSIWVLWIPRLLTRYWRKGQGERLSSVEETTPGPLFQRSCFSLHCGSGVALCSVCFFWCYCDSSSHLRVRTLRGRASPTWRDWTTSINFSAKVRNSIIENVKPVRGHFFLSLHFYPFFSLCLLVCLSVFFLTHFFFSFYPIPFLPPSLLSFSFSVI